MHCKYQRVTRREKEAVNENVCFLWANLCKNLGISFVTELLILGVLYQWMWEFQFFCFSWIRPDAKLRSRGICLHFSMVTLVIAFEDEFLAASLFVSSSCPERLLRQDSNHSPTSALNALPAGLLSKTSIPSHSISTGQAASWHDGSTYTPQPALAFTGCVSSLAEHHDKGSSSTSVSFCLDISTIFMRSHHWCLSGQSQTTRVSYEAPSTSLMMWGFFSLPVPACILPPESCLPAPSLHQWLYFSFWAQSAPLCG